MAQRSSVAGARVRCCSLFSIKSIVSCILSDAAFIVPVSLGCSASSGVALRGVPARGVEPKKRCNGIAIVCRAVLRSCNYCNCSKSALRRL